MALSQQGFVDLRGSSLNASSHTDDSVWPSFTDIMTVVVMIFLMSLVVILLRNVELVKSERESARLAALNASENVELESAIESLEQRIAQIQLQLQAQILKTEKSDQELQQTQEQATRLMADIQALQLLRDKLMGENTELAATKLALEGRLKVVEDEKTSLDELQQQTEQAKFSLEDENQQLLIQIKAALDEQQQLQTELEQQQTSLASLEQEKLIIISDAEKTQTDFDALQAVYSLLKQDNRSLSERISDAEQMIAQLEESLTAAIQTIEQTEQELQVAEEEIQTKTQQIELKTEELAQSQEKFTELEEKYLKLVGPARSAINKYVVAVRYRMLNNRAVIDIADPANSVFEQVSETVLHQKLAELKRRKGKDLYTRVVIPSDSGLSYDQAWRFTQDILNRYDYYYQ